MPQSSQPSFIFLSAEHSNVHWYLKCNCILLGQYFLKQSSCLELNTPILFLFYKTELHLYTLFYIQSISTDALPNPIAQCIATQQPGSFMKFGLVNRPLSD